MRKSYIFGGVAAVALVALLSSVFIVDEREKALVLQFGQIKAVKETPGLAFKLPFIQDVVRYDDRILSLDTDPIEVTPSDDRRLVVDAFARYRIAEVEQFRRAVGVGGVRSAESRLASILTTQTRAVLGSDGVTSNTILSSDRAALMTRIRDQARLRAAALGLEVIDVRLKQTALPDQNLAATFDRMRAEREREATDERARGEEAAQRVRAQADRTRVELVSEAEREAEIARGEADAERNAIFAASFGADPEFFEFYRSLTAYERSLQGDNSTMILSPDSEFFDYLKSDQPRGRTAREGQRAAEELRSTAEPRDDAPRISGNAVNEAEGLTVTDENAPTEEGAATN
ncbi:protease modulator HflC [Maribius pontilimi]|uniref:Protein HflC n=1 Tax=Palleronia pontilimi TaxID=1964209 RepID=A0A934I8U9_9RHOB|nr:protease modulator HflC [Palleronia pontilimi]MBJ3761211.1 protease modulator HflC [Palleronia pontilimi]